jgi:hypothetical protein
MPECLPALPFHACTFTDSRYDPHHVGADSSAKTQRSGDAVRWSPMNRLLQGRRIDGGDP